MSTDILHAKGVVGPVPGQHKPEPEIRSLLSDLQGNILKGHGREEVLLLMLEFRCREEDARSWVRAFGRGWVTTAAIQAEQALDYRSRKIESLFVNLFLTKRGYEYIGLKEDHKIPADPRFRAGMASFKIQGECPEKWEPAYRSDEHPIHAMVLVAASKLSDFDGAIGEVMESLKGLAKVTRQEGRVQKAKEEMEDKGGKKGRELYVEHFNYIDGRSQPLFFAEDLVAESDSGDPCKYDPSAPLGLVLVKDPNGGEHGYGSYLVYRKLEQDVRRFKERERKPSTGSESPKSVADQLELGEEDRNRVGAMVVGRFANGTPLAISDQPNLGRAPNNFNYSDDPEGLKCPLFAHIRKMNPRTEDEESRKHRIVRRGIPYEDVPRPFPPSDDSQAFDQMPEKDVGLLFMCFQISIENQFEYLQKLANDPDLPKANAGTDPLIGRCGERGKEEHHWPMKWGKGPKSKATFGNFVTLKGGEYFFAPCRSFFESLPRRNAI